jgi:hypothetical protein
MFLFIWWNKFEVHTSGSVSSEDVDWGGVPHILVGHYQHFGGTFVTT